VAQDQDNGMAHWAADGVLNPPDHDRVFRRANMLAYIQTNFGALRSITFADSNVTGCNDPAVFDGVATA
jgi:hypothetical protein